MEVMDDTIKLPHVAPELLSYLERIFPDQCPDPSASEREVWMKTGEAQVVRHLRHLQKEQEQEALKANV